MMQTILIAVLTAAQAYLLGSVDTGILISKFVYHDDVRNHGSGAAGMTNMLRTFGKKAAALTAAGDVLKGVAAVCIGRWLFHFSYQRYLINQIRENFGLEHTPIRLVVRERGSGEVGAKDV